MKVRHPEKRAPRIRWLALYAALAFVLTTLWFREGDHGPLHRVRGAVQTFSAPVSAAGEFVTRPLRGVVQWATGLGVSRSQLERLRDQNLELRAMVAELEEARLENERLRALLRIGTSIDFAYVGARVIGRPTNSWDGIVTIDRGTDDGVAPGMAVVGPLGLIGQTVEVSRSSAKVRLITDQRSGVAAMVQRSRAEGVVRGSIDGRLTLDFVSVDATVGPGDVVITSGMGGVFPKGIVIGEVTDVVRNPGALQQTIRVRPSGDPSRLEEVLVLVEGAPGAPTKGGE